ncbi:MAG: hypothetical protein QM784_08450 [Polyangiaceae bacterium]
MSRALRQTRLMRYRFEPLEYFAGYKASMEVHRGLLGRLMPTTSKRVGCELRSLLIVFLIVAFVFLVFFVVFELHHEQMLRPFGSLIFPVPGIPGRTERASRSPRAPRLRCIERKSPLPVKNGIEH